MGGGSIFLNYLIIISVLAQSFYLFIIKRRDKNFYKESGLINLLSTGSGIALMIFNYIALGEFNIGNDTDAKTTVTLLGILVIIVILFILKNLFSGKKYYVTNIDKGDFETILSETLEKYGMSYKTDKNAPQSMVTKIILEEYDASMEVTQKGGKGRSFVLEFKGFSQVYDFDNIIEDMKERVNGITKANRFRGIGELAAAAVLLIFVVWMRIK